MEQLLHEHLGSTVSWILGALALFVLGWHALEAYRGFKGEIISRLALSVNRRLDRLDKRQKRLQQLHDSDREYYGWMLTGVLRVLALLGFQLALEGCLASMYRFQPPILQPAASLSVDFARYFMGIMVYTIAMSRVQDYRALQDFDRTMARVNDVIDRLKVKQAAHKPRSGGITGAAVDV